MKLKIGVLAVQGAFLEHIQMLDKLEVEAYEIRKKDDLLRRNYDGFILPGGESTVMGKLLRELDMLDILKKLIQAGTPVFGTCAGMILLAKDLSNDTSCHIATMDIKVRRNAYGRQLGSFHTQGDVEGIGLVPMTFIRAPFIESVSGDTEVIAVVEKEIVAAKQRNMLVTSFHPELNENFQIHQYFIQEMCLH